MAISAKTNWPPSIQITGVSWWSRINITANLADFMAPAIDADTMFKELGALVTDMQTLGDQGIQKWKQDKQVDAKDATLVTQVINKPLNVHAYALASVAVIGLLIGVESFYYAEAVKKEHLLQVQSQIVDLGERARGNRLIQAWATNLLTKADNEASAGNASFLDKKYVDAMAHWTMAKDIYTNLPHAAAANAFESRSRQKTETGSEQGAKDVSEQLKNATPL